MIKFFLATNILINSLLGFQNPNNPQDFYTSGLENDPEAQVWHSDSSFCYLSFPQKFRFNLEHEALPSGFYMLEPIFENEIPIYINLKQAGKVLGTLTVIDYKKLSYLKSRSSAEIESINNGLNGQVNLYYSNYYIQAVIEFDSSYP